MSAEIVKHGIFCVPKKWKNKKIKEFAQSANPASNGWTIRKKGDPERVPCQERKGYVHIMLDT